MQIKEQVHSTMLLPSSVNFLSASCPAWDSWQHQMLPLSAPLKYQIKAGDFKIPEVNCWMVHSTMLYVVEIARNNVWMMLWNTAYMYIPLIVDLWCHEYIITQLPSSNETWCYLHCSLVWHAVCKVTSIKLNLYTSTWQYLPQQLSELLLISRACM